MYRIPDNEIKDICFSILCYFDDVCRENNLRYSLAYGTLLGAVRHKGFIPWDDDIDVIMPREDYEKLLGLKLYNKRYSILSHKYSRSYRYTFAKMIDTKTLLIEKTKPDQKIGVYIDIFPTDYFFSNDVQALNKENRKRLKYLKWIANTSLNKKKAIVKSLCQNILVLFDKEYVSKQYDKYDKFIESIYSQKGEYCGMLTAGVYGEKEIFLFDLFEGELCELSFEGRKFKVIARYKEFLEQIYGDYLQLPPEEKRISNHSFSGYYLEENGGI